MIKRVGLTVMMISTFTVGSHAQYDAVPGVPNLPVPSTEVCLYNGLAFSTDARLCVAVNTVLICRTTSSGEKALLAGTLPRWVRETDENCRDQNAR